MRVLILCAGDATRWGNYKNAPKQLVTIEGEVLLHRTVRQVIARGVRDVVVVGTDDRFAVNGARLFIPENRTPTGTEADKFLSSRDEWHPTGRTIILYGDVWYSNVAAANIAGSPHRGWGVWRRAKGSRYTGCRYGEVFGMSWWPPQHQLVDGILADATQRYRAATKKIRPCGWQLLDGLTGHMPGGVHNLDDWTEDFDRPDDLDRWLTRRNAGRKHHHRRSATV